MYKALKWLMGVRDEPEGEKCAYRYRVEELITNNESIPERFHDCEYCNGYPMPVGCFNYRTLDHLIGFDTMFKEHGMEKRDGK